MSQQAWVLKRGAVVDRFGCLLELWLAGSLKVVWRKVVNESNKILLREGMTVRHGLRGVV